MQMRRNNGTQALITALIGVLAPASANAGQVTSILDASGLDVAVDGSGNVYYAAGGMYYAAGSMSKVFKITSEGVITEIIDASGDGAGNSFSFPLGVAVGDSGDVYAVAAFHLFKISCQAAPVTFCNDADDSLSSCPCANPGSPDTGCDLSQGTGGVGLSLAAQETSPQNRVTMLGSGFPPASAPASIMIRASTLDPAPPVVFGDGLRCIGSTVVRLAATFASAGQTTHIAGHGAMAGGGDFYYQLWFRNTAGMFCTLAAFNLSSGHIVNW